MKAMSPLLFICLGGCLVGFSAVWLYEFESSINPPEKNKGPNFTEVFRTYVDFARDDGVGLQSAAAEKFRYIPNADLLRQVAELETQLRISARSHDRKLLGNAESAPGDRRDVREINLQYPLLIQAISLASELLFRLGEVEFPSEVDSLSIKLGAAIVASGKPAGENPMLPVANYLVFLSRMLGNEQDISHASPASRRRFAAHRSFGAPQGGYLPFKA